MKIMVCYDGSPESEAALAEARLLTKIFQAETHIVTSLITEDRFHQKEINAAKEALIRASAFFEADNISCETNFSARGLEPGEDIVAFAHEHNIDMIILGVKNRSRVGKVLLGSIVPYVLLNSRCNVLSVKMKDI